MDIAGRIILAAMLLWMVKLDIQDRQRFIALLTAKHIPQASIAFYAAICLKLCGGISILFHVYTPFFALFLGLFFIGATIMFQDFWRSSGEEKATKTLHFVLHMAVAGGIFLSA